MYPIAFSSGLEPLYMEPYNIARVGINLLTADNEFKQDIVEFTDTLIVGEGSRGFDGNFDYIDDSSKAGTCVGATFDTWKKEKGFFEDMSTYGDRFESVSDGICASTMTSENVHEYVEKDQHSITVRSLASGATKISLYVL